MFAPVRSPTLGVWRWGELDVAVCTSALRGGRRRWGSLGLTSHPFRLIDELQFNERPVSKDVANISEDDAQGYDVQATHTCGSIGL